VKKLISIGVALALLAMVVVPVAVAADTYTPPVNYSKIPFQILGTGVEMVGNLVNALGVSLGTLNITAITGTVAPWIEGPFSWLTELTGWTMVAVGDVVGAAADVVGAVAGNSTAAYLTDIQPVFYTMAARLFDPWGTYSGNTTLPDQLETTYPPLG
jgi:hypothetical protein